MTILAETKTEGRFLTKYPSGSLRELGTICWPLILSSFFVCLMGTCDRFFLSRYSFLALEACGSASYLALLFQIPCMKITSVAQVFIGQNKGAGRPHLIGEVVWQMIWFSFLTMLLTVPLGVVAATYFFDNTSIKELGLSYFNCLMLVNFLFPLGAAFTAFFTGQGQTRIVSYAMAVCVAVHIGLDLLLIFGVSGIFPAQGIKGAAFATIISQALYCFILFGFFIRRKERESCGTGQWHIRKDSMYRCIRLGMPRAVARLITLAAWAAVVRVLTRLGGDYLTVLSITGSFCLFFSCLTEGFGNSLITTISYIIGRGEKPYIPTENKPKFSPNWNVLTRAVRSAFMGLVFIMSFLAIFLLIFPEKLLLTFYPPFRSPSQILVLIHACYGLWLFFLFEGISWVGVSLLTAFKDTKFLMLYSGATAWLFNYIPQYTAFSILSWPVTTLWYLMAIPCLTSALAYFLRILRLYFRDKVGAIEGGLQRE